MQVSIVVNGNDNKSSPSNFTMYHENDSNSMCLTSGHIYTFSSKKAEGASDYLPHKWVINSAEFLEINHSYLGNTSDNDTNVTFHYSIENDYDYNRTANLYVKSPMDTSEIYDTDYFDGLFKQYNSIKSPAPMMKAMAYMESSFNVYAYNYSADGRYGLMQTPHSQDEGRPDLAILHGSEILKEKYTTFDSSKYFRMWIGYDDNPLDLSPQPTPDYTGHTDFVTDKYHFAAAGYNGSVWVILSQMAFFDDMAYYYPGDWTHCCGIDEGMREILKFTADPNLCTDIWIQMDGISFNAFQYKIYTQQGAEENLNYVGRLFGTYVYDDYPSFENYASYYGFYP